MPPWRYWLPPAAYLGLIFLLSSMPQPPIPAAVSSDLLHYPEYAVLGFLLARAFYAAFAFRSPLLASLTGVACAVAWGVTDEFHQAFVPNRVPELEDLMRDAAGAAVGALLWLGWRMWRDRRRAAAAGG
jgi:VanZ family protein